MWVYSIQTYTNPAFFTNTYKNHISLQGIYVIDVFIGIGGAPREDEHAKEAAEQATSQGRTVQCWLAEKKPLPAAIPPVGEIHRSRSNLQEPGCLFRLDLWKITLQVHFYKVHLPH